MESRSMIVMAMARTANTGRNHGCLSCSINSNSYNSLTGGAVIFLALVLNIPFLREIFRFSVIHPVDVVISVSAGILSIVWFELFKLFSRKKADISEEKFRGAGTL
jgi:hypothetical protein